MLSESRQAALGPLSGFSFGASRLVELTMSGLCQISRTPGLRALARNGRARSWPFAHTLMPTHAACLQAEAHLADRSPCGDGGATAGPVGRGRTVIGADGVGAGTGAGGGHAAALPGTVYSDSTT